jgi:hypothetical protein
VARFSNWTVARGKSVNIQLRTRYIYIIRNLGDRGNFDVSLALSEIKLHKFPMAQISACTH